MVWCSPDGGWGRRAWACCLRPGTPSLAGSTPRACRSCRWTAWIPRRRPSCSRMLSRLPRRPGCGTGCWWRLAATRWRCWSCPRRSAPPSWREGRRCRTRCRSAPGWSGRSPSGLAACRPLPGPCCCWPRPTTRGRRPRCGAPRRGWGWMLVRSAIYRAATFAERRAAHLALADALDEVGQADRRAWHRASAAIAPDDVVAGELERSAGRARARGGYAAAAAALERAAELTGPEAARARRLAAGAEAAWLAGRPAWALELADRAGRLDPPPRLRAGLQQLRGRIEVWSGSPIQAHRLLADGAAAVAGTDPGQAAQLLSEAAQAAWFAGDEAKTREAGQRLGTLAVPENSPPRLMGRVLVGLADLMIGDTSQAAPQLREVAAIAEMAQTPVQLAFAGHAALFVGDDAAASDLLGRAVAAARASGAVGLLAWMLAQVAALQAWASRWLVAVATASEGLRLATETGQDNAAAQHHGVLAWVAAAQGREQECRAHADAALEQAARRALAVPGSIAVWALGLAELDAGRPAAALDRLEQLAAAQPGLSHPLTATFAAADLAEEI